MLGLLGCVAIYPVSAQNLITNGDFETSPYAPSTTITGWTVSGTGAVHEIEEGSTTPTHSLALNVGGDSQGTIVSQSFATAIGEVYRVDFDAGIFGQPTGGPLQLNVQITGSGSLLNQTVTPPVALTFTPAAVVFGHYYFSFTANSATTTIQFTDIGLGNADADTVVDTVSVQPEENLLTNGNFETGPFDTASTVSGWTVSGNGAIVDRSAQGNAGGSHAAAFSAGGDFQGDILSQSFATVVGQTYVLDFYSGVFGVPDSNATSQQLEPQVIGSGTLLDQVITPPVAGTFDPTLVVFQHYQFSFVANSTTTTLRFTDIGTGNSEADIMLDTVSVAPLLPQLVNGNFESQPIVDGSIVGWNIGGTGKIEVKANGSTTPPYAAAFNTGGDYQGDILSQTLSTIVGRQYSIDFDSGVFGVRSGAALQLQVQLIGNGAVLNQTVTPSYAATYDPTKVKFQHYHYLFTANTNNTLLQFQDIGLGNANADTLLDSVNVLLQPPRSFTRWQSMQFTQAQLNNPSISGWSADPDHDGIPNGLEYFFNMSPLAGIPVKQAPALPRAGIIVSGANRYLTFTYRRPIAWSGTPEIVGVSDNLSAWDETGNQLQLVGTPVPSGDGSTDVVTVQLKTPINQGPIPRKFFRLKISQ